MRLLIILLLCSTVAVAQKVDSTKGLDIGKPKNSKLTEWADNVKVQEVDLSPLQLEDIKLFEKRAKELDELYKKTEKEIFSLPREYETMIYAIIRDKGVDYDFTWEIKDKKIIIKPRTKQQEK